MVEKKTINIGGAWLRLRAYLFVLLAILLGISVVRNVIKVLSIRQEVERERARIEKLKKENEELSRRVSEIQSVEFVEKEVRNKLGLIKEGEVSVVLPDAETLKKLAPIAETEEESLPLPNWKKWIRLFY